MSGARRRRDNAKPPPFPIVGIGAAAGGLKAAGIVLDHTPADSGMAYVLVLRPDRRRRSDAAALLRRHTHMPVAWVTARTRLAPDHVYVAPPGHDLALADGAVVPTPPAGADGGSAVIDHFFRALAQGAGERAIGVILSGGGVDGTQGLKAIKEAGGLAVAQDEAEHAGMPHSAIATGLVDFVVPAAQIAGKLAEARRWAAGFDLFAGEQAGSGNATDALQHILARLRTQVGHDFSHYKHSTLLRRIARRMRVCGLASLDDYLGVLRASPAEADALFRELLISVTHFFRDPEAMAALALQVLPRACQRPAERAVRIWVPGCATGEEAYTLAMLAFESLDGLAAAPRLQVFASDVDEDALAVARRGVYPDAIAGDVSPARLKRFFDRGAGGYVVKPALREAILFTRHDILQDPPFTRLDLISCRNLLIYLEADVQSRLFALFHFALRQRGYLFLGGSEALGDSTRLFAAIDRKARLFQARCVPQAEVHVPLPVGAPLRTPMDELRVSGEERHSVNEELQFTAEELETSQEELQSANEELLAVNQELQARNDDLARANADLSNLIASTDIGTLFLDDALCVRRYTPRLTDIFNLIASDIGRPLAHITHKLGAEDLVADAARVRASQEVIERELASTDGRFYQTRLRPYYAGEHQVGGVVLTFVDVSERHLHEQETQSFNLQLRAQRDYARNIVDTVREPMLVLDGALRVVTASRAFYREFGARREATEETPLHQLGEHQWDVPELRRLLQELLAQGTEVEGFEVRHDFGSGERVLRLNARRLKQASELDPLILLAFEDVTERTRAEAELREREARKTFFLRLGDAMRPLRDARQQTVAAMRVLAHHLGLDRAEYFAIDASGEIATALGGYAEGLPPLHGRFRLADFGADVRRTYAAGRAYVVPDTATLPSPAQRAAFEALGTRAAVGVPNLKDGRLQAVLALSHHAPRAWPPAELALIEETAERTWAALERTRIEQARAQSEAKYRLLFETMDEGFCIIEKQTEAAGAIDFRYVEHNAAFVALTQLAVPLGQTLRAQFPAGADAAVAIYDQVLRSGEPARFERPLSEQGRIMEVHAFRVGGADSAQVAVLFQDVTDRKNAERRQKLLVHELNHRVKNNLAIVQALAAQTFRGAGCNPAVVADFDARLMALAAVHDVLTREKWAGVDVAEIARRSLAVWTIGPAPRVRIAGPGLRLQPAATLALALALHELATNASKYGALSNAYGTVEVAWSVQAGSPDVFRMTWRERGGPPVHEPERRGFGSWLIESGLAQDFGGTVRLLFEPEGVNCTIEASVPEIGEVP